LPPFSVGCAGPQIAKCLTVLLDKKASIFMNSVYVMSFAGLRGFDDTCMGLTIELFNKYPRNREHQPRRGGQCECKWMGHFCVQALRTPNCGIIAAFVERAHRGKNDVLSRQVKNAMTERRQRLEAEALAWPPGCKCSEM